MSARAWHSDCKIDSISLKEKLDQRPGIRNILSTSKGVFRSNPDRYPYALPIPISGNTGNITAGELEVPSLIAVSRGVTEHAAILSLLEKLGLSMGHGGWNPGAVDQGQSECFGNAMRRLKPIACLQSNNLCGARLELAEGRTLFPIGRGRRPADYSGVCARSRGPEGG